MGNLNAVGLNPAISVLLLALSIAIFTLKRPYVSLTIIVAGLYATLGQGVTIGPATLYVTRIVLYLCIIRFVLKGEFKEISSVNSIDKLMFLWAFILINAQFFQKENQGLFIEYTGKAIDTVCVYLTFRITIKTTEDVRKIIPWLLVLLFPVVILMTVEKFTHRNLFSVLGGVPEFSMVREGRLRAQGPFTHPIMAGTAAATFFPFFAAMYWNPFPLKTISFLGVAGMLVIIFDTGSSGPIMTFLFALTGIFAWKVRFFMKNIRWFIFILLILAEIFMKSHCWYILDRIDLVGGSTGWHRAELITQAFNHLNEWWLCGTTYTRHWMPTGVSWSTRHSDITNTFIHQGILGGIFLLLVYIAIIVKCFSNLGKTIRLIENGPFAQRFLIWTLGAILFAHTMTFFSVSYFDQMNIFYLMLVGIIASVTSRIIEQQQIDIQPRVPQ